MSATMIGSCC